MPQLQEVIQLGLILLVLLVDVLRNAVENENKKLESKFIRHSHLYRQPNVHLSMTPMKIMLKVPLTVTHGAHLDIHRAGLDSVGHTSPVTPPAPLSQSLRPSVFPDSLSSPVGPSSPPPPASAGTGPALYG